MAQDTERRLVALLAETSVHAGMGSQLGAVDLPIQRERHTEWPTLYGSGLKGVLRDHAERSGWSAEDVQAVFGPGVAKDKEESRHAGALALSDARLLLFPVRTAAQAFAWVTCPLALARLQRDANQAGLAPPASSAAPTDDEAIVAPKWPKANGGVLLEEFAYKARVDAGVESLANWVAGHLLPAAPAYQYWRDAMPKALVIVSDQDFHDFVRHGTEVVTRVKLTPEKTVQKGALWTEENVPADTLFYSFAAAWKPADVSGANIKDAATVVELVAKLFATSWVVQVGGKETVGRGFMAVRMAGGSNA